MIDNFMHLVYLASDCFFAQAGQPNRTTNKIINKLRFISIEKPAIHNLVVLWKEEQNQ